MATTTPRGGNRRTGDAAGHMDKAYGELQQAAEELTDNALNTGRELGESARSTAREMKEAASRELQMARGTASQLGRRTAITIRRHPWAAMGTALVVGALVGRLLL